MPLNTFFENISGRKRPAATSNASELLTAKERPLVTADLPLVATSGHDIADHRLLEFIVDTMFSGNHLAAIKGQIHNRLSTIELPISESRLDAEIEALLSTIDTTTKSHPLAAAYAALYEHKARAQRARDAYDTSTKENFKAVYWPDPSAPAPHGRPLHGEPPFARRNRVITKQTPIGSAGSCFALEIMKYLKARGYNYVVTEPNAYSCANWGPQYNAVAFQQMVEWVFGLRERPNLVWETTADGKIQYCDPFREGVAYQTLKEIGPDVASHRELARRALEQVEYFVLTVGLNEVWRLANSDTILARFPRDLAPHLIRSEVLTVRQNLDALQGSLDVLRSFNPAIKLIVTVSPIPLYATFQGDTKHVVVATQHAKAVLRVAVEEFASKNPDSVTYFPAMETVLWCTRNPWQDDLRHVSDEAIHNVMRLFEEVFLIPEL